ncbi:MAG: helix-turn-helix domain-containing protein [Proteobacteria bacterium]|nr:helix-turn-helix domain-containing protein [Pseudomonadota bacterium]
MREKLPPPKLAFGIDEAAFALSLGRTKVYALINEGALRTIKIGGRRLITAGSIHRLLDPTEGGSGDA